MRGNTFVKGASSSVVAAPFATALFAAPSLFAADATKTKGNATAATSSNFEGLERRGDHFTATRALFQRLITKDFAQVLSDAKAEPVVKANQIIGFKLSRIKSGSVYEALDFRDGDLITKINGQALGDVGRAIVLLHSLQQSTSFEFDVVRGGRTQRKRLSIR